MGIPFIKLLPVRFHCYKVLPLVYDESLSYYEQLCKVIHTLNDSIKAINDLQAAVGDMSDLSARVNELAENISAFESNVNTILNDMNETLLMYDDKFSSYDTRFNDLENQLNETINNNVKALKDYIDETLLNIDVEVKELIEKELIDIYNKFDTLEADLRKDFAEEIAKLIASVPDLTNIEVINPVTGVLSKVQVALDDIFMNTRYYALTVDEWNHLKMDINTANTLLKYSAPTGWSIIDWLTKAKEWLNKNPKLMMHNFITGVTENYKKNIELNNDLLRVCGCLTCAEFAGLNITVDVFNEVGADCETLAWKSNRIFT